MIYPDIVLGLMKTQVLVHKSDIGITDFQLISEDTSPGMKPPYAGAFANFELESEDITGTGDPFSIPVEIKVWFFSSPKKSAEEACTEALTLAMRAIEYLKGSYSSDEESIAVHVRPKPFDLLAKKASQSVIQLNLYYILGEL